MFNDWSICYVQTGTFDSKELGLSSVLNGFLKVFWTLLSIMDIPLYENQSVP